MVTVADGGLSPAASSGGRPRSLVFLLVVAGMLRYRLELQPRLGVVSMGPAGRVPHDAFFRYSWYCCPRFLRPVGLVLSWVSVSHGRHDHNEHAHGRLILFTAFGEWLKKLEWTTPDQLTISITMAIAFFKRSEYRNHLPPATFDNIAIVFGFLFFFNGRRLASSWFEAVLSRSS